MKTSLKLGGSTSKSRKVIKRLSKLQLSEKSKNFKTNKKTFKTKKYLNAPHNTSQFLIHSYHKNFSQEEDDEEIPSGSIKEILEHNNLSFSKTLTSCEDLSFLSFMM